MSLHKRSILKKTSQMGISSLVSKVLGIIREILQVSFLGVGPISDAFSVAYRVPNFLRKIFAEGALSAAFIPTLVRIVKEKKDDDASRLMVLLFFSIGLIVFSITIGFFVFAEKVILLFAPGFACKPIELATAVPLLKVLIFFILFISLASMLAGAMQAKHHFTVPSWGPVLLNIAYILGLLISIKFGLSVFKFALFILLGGLFQLSIFAYKYFQLNYQFLWPDSTALKNFKQIMFKFLPCLISVGIVEFNLLIDSSFASILPSGSITVLNISSKFMQIALSSFAAAFSAILLSHFSSIITYAPKRLSYYFLESSKFMFWVTIPVTLLMSFFAYDIFYTLFYQLSSFTLEQVQEASKLLIAFVIGLFFYSINKLILSLYYTFGRVLLPTIISLFGTLANVFLNLLFVCKYKALGLAIATTLSAIIQTVLLLFMLNKKYNFKISIRPFYINFTRDFSFNFKIYYGPFLSFFYRYFFQLFVISLIFYIFYRFINLFITKYMPFFQNFLLHQIGLWLWVGPLVLFMFALMYIWRKKFNVKIYYLD